MNINTRVANEEEEAQKMSVGVVDAPRGTLKNRGKQKYDSEECFLA